MIIFHNQKSTFITFYNVSLHHVSTKIFVEYHFLEYLVVSFDLFWQQKQPPEVFCKKVALKNFTNFTVKHLCWSLFFNKVVAILSHFEEHLWTTASVLWPAQFPEIIFLKAKILFCYYLSWILQLATVLKMDSIIGVIFSLKTCCWWTNEQNPHCFKKCHRSKLQTATVLNTSSITDV